MTNLVIAFSGRISSGKTSLARAVAVRGHAKYASFGEYIREVAAFIGRDAEDRKTLQEVGAFLASHPESLCKKTLESAAYQPGSPLVVDGIRHVEVLNTLRSQVQPSELVLVHVMAPDSSVRRRLREGRNINDNIKVLEQHSTEEQVNNALPLVADLIVNNPDGKNLEDAVEEVISWLQNVHSKKTPKQDPLLTQRSL
jgi:dephospho-CoA kinase